MINVYKASAGSGKTFKLVREYLKLLLGIKKEDGSYRLNAKGVNMHRSILAITFTNKATNEMKQRIVKELDILAHNDAKSDHIEYLMEQLHASEEDIRQCAQKALYRLLHDFSNFNVSTIDTFFQLILRTFARETEISYNYNVELDNDYAVSVGIAELKQSLHLHSDTGRNEHNLLLKWLEAFMKANIDAGKTWDIFAPGGKYSDTLYTFARGLANETVRNHRKKLTDYLADKSRIQEFSREIIEKRKESQNKIADAAGRFLTLTESAGVQPDMYYYKFDEKLRFLASGQPPQTATERNYRTKVVEATEPKKWVKKAGQPLVAPIKDSLSDCIEEIQQAAYESDKLRMIGERLYALGLLGDIDSYISEFKKENNVILLSDTNEMLRRIINKDDTPFIYERVGVKLRHFLIDEFQDTSRMQWENLEPLLQNSVATDNDNLIIGDVKQSIYRFRNSDPNLLRTEVSKTFRGLVKESGNDIVSNTNWRSSRNVVLWNNTFFSLLANRMYDILGDVYANVVQQVAPKKSIREGYVRIERLDGEKKEDFMENALDRTTADIAGMLSRGYRQRDITVLVSTKADGEAVIAKLLAYAGEHPDATPLNVVSEESLLICKSAAVKIIVGILSMLDNTNAFTVGTDERETGEPARRYSLPLLLKQYEYNIGTGMQPSEAFSEVFSQTFSSGSKTLNDKEIEYLLGSGDCAGLDAIVERIVKDYVPDSLRISDTPYIQAFEDNLIDYMSRYGSNLHMFLQWWDAASASASISSPDNIDAIKVMTIHKSKGLEFPCVIIPFCNWSFDKEEITWVRGENLTGFKDETIPPILPVKRPANPKEDTPFYEEFQRMHSDNVLDSVNKTYVAFTRAVDELIIYYPNTKSKSDMQTQFDELLGTAESTVESVCAKQIREAGDARVVLTPAKFYNGTDKFEIGNPTFPAAPKNNKNKDSNSTVLPMPGYEVTYHSELWKFELPDAILAPRESPLFKGDTMHNILSRVNKLGDEDYALRSFLAKGLISKEEMEEFGSVIRKGIYDKRVALWFAPENRVISERTIINSIGQQKRIDRLVITPENHAIVIDYKFGEENDKKYFEQVRDYMVLLCDSGYTDIEGWVWYVPEMRFLQVKL